MVPLNVRVVALLDHVVKGTTCLPSPGWIHRSHPLDLLSLPPPSWGQTVCLPLTTALIIPDPGYLPQGLHPHPLTPPDNDISRLFIKATKSEVVPSRVPLHLPCKFRVLLKHIKKEAEAGGKRHPRQFSSACLPLSPREWGCCYAL